MEPKLSEEKRLWKKGFKRVACLDEAGRGSLSGPVVAAAVMVNLKGKKKKEKPQLKFKNLDLFKNYDLEIKNLLKEVNDSKKLTPKRREEIYQVLTNHPEIKWGIGRVSEKVIDRINILEATKLTMKKAINNLKSKIQISKSKINPKSKIQNSKPDFLIIDGNFKIDLNIPQKSIVKADEKVFSCAVASILAKVTRDRIMQKYHKKYPKYRFDKHKGYPTKLHRKMLKRYGPCKIHRMSFKPVQINSKS